MRLKGRLLLCVVCATTLASVAILYRQSGGAGSSASAQAPTEAPTPQTDDSLPAGQVTMIGSTPLEAPGEQEAWGVGRDGSQAVVVRYAKQAGWTLQQSLPAGFAPDAGPLAGQMTPSGVGVLLGTSGGSKQELLVRKPGDGFAATAPVPSEGETPPPGEEPLLSGDEELYSPTRAPLLAPLDEEGGGAGALIAPVRSGTGVERQVLHWDGTKWSSEPIQIPANSAGDFRVLALAASGPSDAWLLAQLSSAYPAGSVALFRRVREGSGAGAKWLWAPAVAPGGEAGEAEPLRVPLHHESETRSPAILTVAGRGEPPIASSQLLTVTSEGVWIDGERADLPEQATGSTATLFYKPAGAGGEVTASWCQTPGGAEPAQCSFELPEELPSGPSRSFAWADGSRFGERVITGFGEGVSLSLGPDGRFERVLALGAGVSPQEDPGAYYGAAFASPGEGWLGESVMPVHLTHEPQPSRLAPWPTSFRHPLLAVAPQPGQPVGALASEALAAGDSGAVARYKPNVGWLPESLFGPGQRVEHPRLRAVAWPTPTRAFAVGDYSSEDSNMWLWRAETAMWEPDPAMPLNFRGNLLGVAFDPSDPARGYAVGSSAIADVQEGGETRPATGVLLRYGKTWTQETALPPQAQGASFVSVAFAGSEAIVAYRKRLRPNSSTIVGGLIVNDGSGWRVDEAAAAAMGPAYPGAVAGLPDGGAAFTAIGPEGPRVYERESTGAPWHATAAPLPGLGAGSLAVFREGGAMRAIVAAGGVANEGAPVSPPPGFPPALLPPFSPVGGGPQSGGIVRQTASGWSDEQHELNPAGEPPGSYEAHDIPYRPDPILAVLTDPTGTHGWAVGGNISTAQGGRLETGDVERYPADGSAPVGEQASPVALEAPAHAVPGEKAVTLAIGGGAQCAAPCAERARAGVGPDVWLADALAHARSVTGLPAFFYTGPYVTQAKVNGPRSRPVPFAQELEQYASLLGSGSPLPVYAAASPQELDARPEREGSEQLFEEKLGAVEPFGAGSEGPERKACAIEDGCGADYYALDVQGPGGRAVRAIVLDDGLEMQGAQLTWLEGELNAAASVPEPAVVIGNGDLNAQIAANPGGMAARVAAALVNGGASAYFFDSPEENVKQPLRALGSQIDEFGSGTLGYVSVQNEVFQTFHGASGFLLAQVEMAGYSNPSRTPASNRAPIAVRLIPNVAELALEAQGGILLRRSSVSLFQGLARRPRAGGRGGEKDEESEVDPYIPIPSYCSGAGCETTYLFPEYSFTSSRPDIGQFVVRNLAVSGSHAVLPGREGKPIPDEPRNVKGELTPDGQFEVGAGRQPINERGEAVPPAQSSLFCAYNAGETTITISAGGLSASLPVKIERGSVRAPCGTVPLKELPPAKEKAGAPSPPPTEGPGSGTSPSPAGTAPLPVPLPPPPATPASAPKPAAATHPFVPLVALTAPVLAFVPPPPPSPARPSPPSGTSAVTSPIEVAEKEEEEESATESASAQAVAYRSSDDEPRATYLLAALALAALAGASVRRPRRGRRAVRVAPATISAMRRERQLEPRPRRGGGTGR